MIVSSRPSWATWSVQGQLVSSETLEKASAFLSNLIYNRVHFPVVSFLGVSIRCYKRIKMCLGTYMTCSKHLLGRKETPMTSRVTCDSECCWGYPVLWVCWVGQDSIWWHQWALQLLFCPGLQCDRKTCNPMLTLFLPKFFNCYFIHCNAIKSSCWETNHAAKTKPILFTTSCRLSFPNCTTASNAPSTWLGYSN